MEDRLRKPLHGTRTHALSPHAFGILVKLSAAPLPSQEINPGVINRLMRESLAMVVRLPSPYKTHRGQLINFLEITDQGRALLRAPATAAGVHR